MEVLGSFGLILSCGCIGLWLASRIKRRPKELREGLTALVLLDTEIAWGATPLPEACTTLRDRLENPWRGFFGELSDRILRGESAGAAWKATIRSQTKNFCLKPQDWQVLGEVGKGLGRSDRQEQHKQLELAKRQLELVQGQVGDWAEKQAKMWSYLGFLLGMAGAIVLI